MIINHGKWRRNNSVIIEMFLNVYYTSTLIVRGSTKSTFEILTNALDTYFSSKKWKSTLGKEMKVSHCVTITTLNYFKPTTQQKNSTNTNPMFQLFLPNRDNLNVYSMVNDKIVIPSWPHSLVQRFDFNTCT
jgi:hypothetical protein